MSLSNIQPESGNISSQPVFIKVLRIVFAACIALGPLTFLLYAIFGPSGGNGGLSVITANRAENATMNQLHLLFGVLASFFLPAGFLGMALLAIRRSPWLGTISALLALPSWTPFSALIALDALSYDMAQMGGGMQLAALWDRFNVDGVMFSYLLIYAACHLICAVLLGIALWRARIIPLWAAIALVVSSPLTIIAFPTHSNILKYLVLVLLTIGSIPAAWAMLQFRSDELSFPTRKETASTS